MSDLLSHWALPLLVLGSIVDLMQFLFALRRWFFKVRRRLYHRIERRILEDQAKRAKA
jgi:hypothetical protein